jgi:hypothetical protein
MERIIALGVLGNIEEAALYTFVIGKDKTANNECAEARFRTTWVHVRCTSKNEPALREAEYREQDQPIQMPWGRLCIDQFPESLHPRVHSVAMIAVARHSDKIRCGALTRHP